MSIVYLKAPDKCLVSFRGRNQGSEYNWWNEPGKLINSSDGE